jgi:hypothetical protein
LVPIRDHEASIDPLVSSPGEVRFSKCRACLSPRPWGQVSRSNWRGATEIKGSPGKPS